MGNIMARHARCALTAGIFLRSINDSPVSAAPRLLLACVCTHMDGTSTNVTSRRNGALRLRMVPGFSGFCAHSRVSAAFRASTFHALRGSVAVRACASTARGHAPRDFSALPRIFRA